MLERFSSPVHMLQVEVLTRIPPSLLPPRAPPQQMNPVAPPEFATNSVWETERVK